VFHTIVSIKNDGHYFCRAGGNRPDGLNEPVTFLSATSRLLNSQTGIVSQRILQFFEISDLKVVTMICVGAQIMSDYDRLM
ncbi:hypothetical protein ACN393_004469, partial [Escherichia coli]